MTRRCSIDGCDKKHYGNGYCSMHNARNRHHGSPYITKHAPPGESLKFLIEVAFKYEGDLCLLWPFGKGADGYGLIQLEGKKQRVPRLVCAEANGDPSDPSLDAAHSCGKGHLGCITKKHLRWATRKENVSDAREHGTICTGERHSHAKLTWDAVSRIRDDHASLGTTKLSRAYGVSTSTISAVVHNKSWISALQPKERQ